MKYTPFFTALMPAVLLFAAVPAGPAAAQGLPDFVTVQFDPSCGPARAQVPSSGPNRGSLVVQLDDFNVVTQPDLEVRRSCEIRATIDVGPGMTFRPVRAFADGEVSTSESGSARVEMTYDWSTSGPSMGRSIAEDFGPRTQRAFVVSTEEHDRGMWVSCAAGAPRRVYLNGRVDVRATRAFQDGLDSDIAVFNTEGQAVRWIWEWGACDFNDKLFRSRYTNPRGIWIRGRTRLVGNHGEYETDQGGQGTFENVRYEEQGRVAKGFWRYETGDRGWFIFRIAADGAGFTGTWGYGDEVGAGGEVGRWQGDQLATD